MGARARVGPHLRKSALRGAARHDAAHRDAPQSALPAQAAGGLPRPEPRLELAGRDPLRGRRRAPDGARTPSHLAAEGVHLCSERTLSFADAGLVSFLRPLAFLAHLLEWAGRYCAQVGDTLPAYNGMRRAETAHARWQRPTRAVDQRGRERAPHACVVQAPARPAVAQVHAGARACRPARVGHALSSAARDQAHAVNGHARPVDPARRRPPPRRAPLHLR